MGLCRARHKPILNNNYKNISALNEFESGEWWVRSNTDSITWDRTIAKHIVKRLRQTRTLPFFYGLGFINPHNPFTPHLSAWNKVGDPSVQELLP